MTKSETRLAVVAGVVLALAMGFYAANSLLLAPLWAAQSRKTELQNRLDKAQKLLDQRDNYVKTWWSTTTRLPGTDPIKASTLAAEKVNDLINTVLPARLGVGRPSLGTFGKSNFRTIYLPVTGGITVGQLVQFLHRIYEENMLLQVRNFSLAQEPARGPGQMRLNLQLASLAVPPDKFVQKFVNTPPKGTPSPVIRVAWIEPKLYHPPAMSEPTATPVPAPPPVERSPNVEATPGPAPLRAREFYSDPEKAWAVLVEANGENPKMVKEGETIAGLKVLYLHGVYGMVLVEGNRTYIVPWGRTTETKELLNAENYPELVEELRDQHVTWPGMK